MDVRKNVVLDGEENFIHPEKVIVKGFRRSSTLDLSSERSMLSTAPSIYPSCPVSKGGSVEIGKMMAVDTDGSINSAQVKQMERGLETHTANIAVLTEDNVALKADSVALKADNVALKADSAALKADNVALKADSAALKTANTDFVRHTKHIPAAHFGTLLSLNAQEWRFRALD